MVVVGGYLVVSVVCGVSQSFLWYVVSSVVVSHVVGVANGFAVVAVVSGCECVAFDCVLIASSLFYCG